MRGHGRPRRGERSPRLGLAHRVVEHRPRESQIAFEPLDARTKGSMRFLPALCVRPCGVALRSQAVELEACFGELFLEPFGTFAVAEKLSLEALRGGPCFFEVQAQLAEIPLLAGE